jgi:uncharacterized protein
MGWRCLSLGIICIASTFAAATAPCARTGFISQPVKTDRELLRMLRGARDGDREAQFRAGLNYETGCGAPQDFVQAAQWYRKAADNGHPLAQNNLARLYLEGLGVAQSDAEAMKWYLRAASEGFAPAQNNVGYMYETGRAGWNTAASSSSDNEAVKWYRKAAESGSAAGELNLGLAYFNGTGIRQDLTEAVKWFRKAAAHGSGAACDQLGRAYQNGAGVPRDDQIARNWYRLAINSRYRQAEQDLASLNTVSLHSASGVGTIHVRHPPGPEITF